ncbi:thymidylate synthase/dCMP hydroxymethylase domain-containing protein [Pisolithus thermaeus]|nr:thymidylate synthase/dCMP hydroxymethylase domain-containing protein [Pisolithus thermaeus]
MIVAACADSDHEEYQYLNLVRRAIENGESREDRTGTGTLSIFAPSPLRFSLKDRTFPLLTTKKIFMKGIAEELLWFIRGDTDAKALDSKGVRIWNGNGSKEFLEKRGLGHREEGDLGPIYGFQWRHFGAEYVDCKTDYTGHGVDQLQDCIRKIVETPTDRRIILSAWNPAAIPQMALPPCHMMCQFYVHVSPDASSKNRLSCLMYQRSADLGLGIPFNIASYALLTHIIAQVTNTEAHELIIQLGDAHVYKDHVEALEKQLERHPKPFPKLRFKKELKSLHDVEQLKYSAKAAESDFVVEGYQSHEAIPMKMSV